jgi:hypothetical protein
MSCYGWKDLFGFAGAAGQLTPGQCSYFEGSTVLPQVVGWVVVVAFGGGKPAQYSSPSLHCAGAAAGRASPAYTANPYAEQQL